MRLGALQKDRVNAEGSAGVSREGSLTASKAKAKEPAAVTSRLKVVEEAVNAAISRRQARMEAVRHTVVGNISWAKQTMSQGSTRMGMLPQLQAQLDDIEARIRMVPKQVMKPLAVRG